MSLALNKPNNVVTLRTNYKVKEEITKLNLECPEFGSGVPYNPALVCCIMCERFANSEVARYYLKLIPWGHRSRKNHITLKKLLIS